MDKLKVVLDTNVVLSGLKSSQGYSYKLLQQVPDGNFEIAISVPLVLEYEAVLKRQLDKDIFSNSDVDAFISFLCLVGVSTKIFYLWRPILSDPNDDHVLELAVAANSGYIVTFNVKDFAEAKKFGITALTPKEFLKFLGE